MKKNFVFKFGIIGCGKIAHKRAKFIEKKNILFCYDINKKNSSKFSKKYSCKVSKNINEMFANKNINSVIISTYHNSLSKITLEAYKKNLNVFVEKPLGKNLKDLKNLIQKISKIKSKNIIQVGYNHRFHPSILMIKKLLKNKKKTGKIMYIRSRYGHGGRKNYEKEWRSVKKLSGGGELIDQGSHLIDLSRYFLGKFKYIKSEISTKFWNMKVEDNAFLILKNKNNQLAHLHCSCTEWKNLFSFEVFCQRAKFEVEGLGGSYGVEKLKIYYMSQKMGKPKSKIIKFINNDRSWKNELDIFKKSIMCNKEFGPTINDAFENMKVIDSCYKKLNKI